MGAKLAFCGVKGMVSIKYVIKSVLITCGQCSRIMQILWAATCNNRGLGTLCLLVMFWTDVTWGLLGSERIFNIWEEEANDNDVLMCDSSPSTILPVPIESDLAAAEVTAALRCMKLAMMESRASSCHSSASRSPWTIHRWVLAHHGSFSIVLLLDELWDLGSDGLQVTSCCLRHAAWCMWFA